MVGFGPMGYLESATSACQCRALDGASFIISGDPGVEQVPFPESGLAGDHSKHFARDLARFVLLDVLFEGEGELLLHC